MIQLNCGCWIERWTIRQTLISVDLQTASLSPPVSLPFVKVFEESPGTGEAAPLAFDGLPCHDFRIALAAQRQNYGGPWRRVCHRPEL